MNQLERENAEFLFKVLDDCLSEFVEEDLHQFYMNGKGSILGLKSFIKKLVLQIKEKFGRDNFNQWFPVITAAMNDFLDVENYPVKPSYRQIVYEEFLEFCNEIADSYWDHVKARDMIKKLTPPVHDMAVDFVKLLHGDDGVSKRRIVYELDIDLRTVTNNLKRLDIKNRGKLPPLRIGGQPVYLDIKSERREQDEYEEWEELEDIIYTARYKQRNYYYTPDTMHPLVMQYNVTQAALLMKALYNYNSENEDSICYDMAVDIWCQLSEYGRNRIKKIFGSNDTDFNDFLKEMEDAISSNKVIAFMPEEKFLDKDSDVPPEQQLTVAFKGSKVCRIVFTSSSRLETLDGQRILYDDKGYYAVQQDEVIGIVHTGSSKKIYLKLEEIKQIIGE